MTSRPPALPRGPTPLSRRGLRDLLRPGNRLEALRGPPQGSVEHPDQRPVADLFRVAEKKPPTGQSGRMQCLIPVTQRGHAEPGS